MKYVVSASTFSKKEQALNQLQIWFDEGKLRPKTKIYEVKKSWTLEELIKDLNEKS